MGPSTSPPPPARAPRVAVLGDDGAIYDVFEVVAWDGATLVVRAALLFEVGEQLRLRVEGEGAPRELDARVDRHDRAGDAVHTALVLDVAAGARQVVSG